MIDKVSQSNEHRTNRLEESCKNAIKSLEAENFIVASIHDHEAVDSIVEKMLKDGIGMGGFNQFVCFVIGNAGDPRYLESVVKLKGGERRNMPMALSHSPEIVTPFADLERIPNFMQSYFLDNDHMRGTFGGLTFLRFPARHDVVGFLPSQVVSGIEKGLPMLQNWIPSPVLTPLVLGMERRGMTVGITSLNRHGTPEMINQVKAAELAKEYLGGFLYDENFPNDLSAQKNKEGNHMFPLGSFPVIEIGDHLDGGIALVRQGPIDERVIKALLKKEGLYVNQNSTKYPVFPFPNELIDALNREENPSTVRQIIMEYLRSIR